MEYLLYGLLALVVLLLVVKQFFLPRMKEAAARKGREMGVDLPSQLVKRETRHYDQGLSFADPAAGEQLVRTVLDSSRGIKPAGAAAWHFKVVQPEDGLIEWVLQGAEGLVRITTVRETLGQLIAGKAWGRVLGAIEKAAAEQGVSCHRAQVPHERSAEQIEGEHVWRLTAE